jgi:hypothetical protein
MLAGAEDVFHVFLSRVGRAVTRASFRLVIASEAKQSISPLAALWIASSPRSSQ